MIRPRAAAFLAALAGCALAESVLAGCGTAARLPPLPTGTVAFLPLDGDGRDAAGRHALVLHGTSFVPDRAGRPGRALAFDGHDDRAEIAPAPDLGFDLRTESYTVALWVRSDAAGTARLVQAWDERASAYAFSLQTDADGLDGVVYDRGRASLVRIPALWDGAWHHVAVTFDAARGVLAGHRDGAEVSRLPVVVRGSTRTRTPVYVGSAPVPGRFFQGDVDDVLVARRALGADEIRALAARP